MMLLARVVAVLCGTVILGAIAHSTIASTGGYGTPHAYLTLSVAGGVAVASFFCGMAQSRMIVLVFVLCIAAGEIYNLGLTVNRIMAASDRDQAPKREYRKTYAEAERKVAMAKAALEAASKGASARLSKAEEAKRAADAAVAEKSSERFCRGECAKMLTAAADDARAEVAAARAEIDINRSKAAAYLRAAETDLANLEAPVSPTPFADAVDMPSWMWDVFLAGMGAIAINGLGCVLIAFGSHASRSHNRQEKPRLLDRLVSRLRRNKKPAAAPSNVVPLVQKSTPTISAKQMVTFLAQCAPEGGRRDKAEWGELYRAYLPWHARVAPSDKPYSAAEFGAVLAAVCEKAEIPVREEGELVYCVGRRLG
jgi:hypothetical protein